MAIGLALTLGRPFNVNYGGVWSLKKQHIKIGGGGSHRITPKSSSAITNKSRVPDHGNKYIGSSILSMVTDNKCDAALLMLFCCSIVGALLVTWNIVFGFIMCYILAHHHRFVAFVCLGAAGPGLAAVWFRPPVLRSMWTKQGLVGSFRYWVV